MTLLNTCIAQTRAEVRSKWVSSACYKL